jgi:signal transduction histidine kinase
VYGIVDTYVGFGMVAGFAESYAERGRLIATLIRQSLAAASPAASPAVLVSPSRCVADAHALQRWSLDEQRLPDGCEIRFANNTFWHEHWWQVLVALALIIGQSLLIATMFAQRSRGRVAEAEARKRLSEMAHLNRRVALGEMSASIAHELNQPLGAIYNNAGAAEILIKADPPRLADVAEILDDIKREDQRASDIIARIRKFLRKSDFELREADLNEVVGESMRTVAGEALDKKVVVKSVLEPGLPLVRADRVQLQQVIVNLALNAIEAMQGTPTEGRVLTVRSRRRDDATVEVSLRDTGPGIPETVLPRIFEAFVTSKSTGMGLGLAISRTIVEAHGGEIRAENASGGGGAEFHFTVPFATAAHT